MGTLNFILDTNIVICLQTGLNRLYWQVGQRIRTDRLREEDRVAYGERIVATLSRQLMQRYGKGFTKSVLNRMAQFAEVFPDYQIVATLSQQLSWLDKNDRQSGEDAPLGLISAPVRTGKPSNYSNWLGGAMNTIRRRFVGANLFAPCHRISNNHAA